VLGQRVKGFGMSSRTYMFGVKIKIFLNLYMSEKIIKCTFCDPCQEICKVTIN
jgi:hypothetical protein